MVYLLGTEEIGKLIRDLSGIYGFRLEYNSGRNDSIFERVSLTIRDVVYSITCNGNGECWEDLLKFVPTDAALETEKRELFNQGINYENVDIERTLRILKHNNYYEFVVFVKAYDINDDDFDFEERNIKKFSYTINDDGFCSSIIANFMNNTSLGFNARLNGGKNEWIIEV